MLAGGVTVAAGPRGLQLEPMERADGGQAARADMQSSGFMAAGGDVDDAGDAGGVVVVAVDGVPPDGVGGDVAGGEDGVAAHVDDAARSAVGWHEMKSSVVGWRAVLSGSVGRHEKLSGAFAWRHESMLCIAGTGSGAVAWRYVSML